MFNTLCWCVQEILRIVVAMFSINKNNVSKVSDETRVPLNRLNTMDDLKLIDSKPSFDILANNERKVLVEDGEKPRSIQLTR